MLNRRNGSRLFCKFLNWRVAVVLTLAAGFFPVRAAAGVALIQHVSKDAGVTASSSLAFPANNTVGDWIGVVIRGGHSGQVFTVSDTRGNIYKPAVQFNQTLDTPNGETLAIYFAENIAGGANTVTVAESITNNTLRFAILEYSGIATANSLDVTAAAQGSGTSLNSGPATTTANGDLILGELASASGVTFTAGAGYTIEEAAPAPSQTKVMVEDAIQAVAGSISASGTMSSSTNGGAMLAAFKAATGGGGAPNITSLTPNNGPVGTSVTIAGTNFGSQTGNSVTFNGVAANPTSWTSTSIVAPVPNGATTGNVVVTVGGQASNGMLFTVGTPAPAITSLTPNSGPVGTSVTIAGTSFGSQTGNSVTFNGVAANPTSWTSTSIVAPVPNGATTGNVVVTVGGQASNGAAFSVTTPPGTITLVQHISKDAGVTAASSLAFPAANTAGNWIGVVIRGGHSGQVFTVSDTRGNAYKQAVQLNQTLDTPNGETLAIYYAESIAGGANSVTVAESITNNTLRFAILEYAGVVGSNSLDVTSAAQGSGTSLNSGPVTTTANGDLLVGELASASGVAFTAGSGYAIEESIPAASQTKMVAEDAIQTAAGPASAGGTMSSSTNGGALLAAFKAASGGGGGGPNLSSLTPNIGPVGTSVTIAGTNLGSQPGNTVTFNGVTATPTSWTSTSIVTPVPTGATTGNVIVTVNGVASNGLLFTVGTPTPVINSLTPNIGPVGTSVTIAGSNFGSQSGNSVTFNGIVATPTSWTSTSIVAPVPSGATTGNVVVTVGGQASNGLLFTVGTPAPVINSLTPNSGPVGTSVTIAGTNFGSQTGNSVTFNGIAATPASWTSTSIVAPVPNGATTGNVIVTVGGVASNGALFNVTVPNSSGIALVQHTSKDAGSVSSSTLAFASNNTAGDFIAVVIRGTKVSQVFTVSDSRGNSYKQAVQANMTVDRETVAIYYAESIGGGANTVTVAQSISGNPLRFAILEYSGVATSNSLDVTAFAQGADTEPNSGSAITNSVGDLLIAEMTNGDGTTYSPGAGFVIEEVQPAAPASKMMVEDGIQALPGPVPGIASMATSHNWGAVMAAFRPAPFSAGPHILGVSPGTAPAGTLVVIAGTNFGGSQGSSTVAFNGTAAAPRSWSNTSIVVPVPAGATSGSVVVTVGGTPSNGATFNVSLAPPIAFVQVNASQNVEIPTAITQSFVTVPYKGAQTAGNLNVIVVGWHGSATIGAINDSAGNAYTLAAGPTARSGSGTQAIYYAKDILPSPPNSNVVSVSFSGTVTNPDMRIAEYTGLDPLNPFDVAASGQGSGSTCDSGAVNTTSANELLVGACVATTSAAGVGFTSRVISINGGNLEDRVVAATGSYNATAAVGSSSSWVMQMVAFKAPTSATPAISVAVSPGAANTPTGYGVQDFGAILQNDIQRMGVTWTLSGTGCNGAACGSLANITPTSARYIAPGNLPSPSTVFVTATSVADPTQSASATVTVTQGTLNVAITPKRAAITLSQTQQFAAPVSNDPANAGVVWSVDGNNGGNAVTGTITSAGLFTPGTQAGAHTVTASSVTNASVNASATVAVTDFAGAFSFHYNPQSTGENTQEYALTPANVNSSTFGLLFSCPVDGLMFATPLYVPNLMVGGQPRNVVYIATEHNSVYAFDADSPACVALWKTSFLSSAVTPVSPGDTGDTVSLVTEFGITSTPVIDLTSNTIYVVANTRETIGTGCSGSSPCYFYRLHALDLITGAEKTGSPVAITAPNFSALFQLQRPALLFANNNVYVAFGSHADMNTWQGWVMAYSYNGTSFTQTYAWSSTVPTGGNNKGAIWGSGNPPVSDAGGNVYVITGNGTFDGGPNYSDSVVKLSPSGTVLDSFTPFDQATLANNDIDLGSSGAIILPDSVGSSGHQHLLLATGKVGVLYLLDQTNLGGFSVGSNKDVQEVNIGFNTTQGDSGFFGQPAYSNGNIYTVMTRDSLRQFPIANGVITNPAFSVASKIYPYRGATPSVSSNGGTNGIVWVEDITNYQSNGPTLLDAYDASHATTMLYSSPVNGPGAACSASKFTTPVVANGKVYIGGSNCFSVFGLQPN